MVCGSKRYNAQIKHEEELHAVSVSARTPAEARKAIRREFGRDTKILSVQEKKGPSRIEI